MLYKRVELNEGELVQYVGVYVLRWRPEMGEPEAGFVQIDLNNCDQCPVCQRDMRDIPADTLTRKDAIVRG